VNADAHHERAHAQWSASATSRNAVCAGAIAMETMCEDRETEAAAWGTCAHQLSEVCLRQQREASSFIGETQKSGKFEFLVDDEMADCAQTYVDYVHEASVYGIGKNLWIEQHFTLEKLSTPLEAGGTADAVIYDRDGELEVVDLKGGRGVIVEVAGNPQMRTYALGAVLAFPELDVKTIKVTIVQPRAHHKDGRIRSETFHVADLLEWAADLLVMMKRSRAALDEFAGVGARRTSGVDPSDGEEVHGVAFDNSVAFDAWTEKWLTTGQCLFCPAKAICPAVRKEVMNRIPAVAAKWFEDPSISVPLNISNLPRTASPEELAHFLDGFEMLESWISAVRAYAHNQAEGGVAIPGYQLAQKIGNRAWIDEVKTSEALVTIGLGEKQIFENKMRSPAQIEKILGVKRKAEIEPLVHRPVRGSNLVATSKTSRPATQSLVERHHEQL
jgi:hypothetical protein